MQFAVHSRRRRPAPDRQSGPKPASIHRRCNNWSINSVTANKLFSTNAAVKCLSQPVLKDVDVGRYRRRQFTQPDAVVLMAGQGGWGVRIRVLFRKSIHMRRTIKKPDNGVNALSGLRIYFHPSLLTLAAPAHFSHVRVRS